MEDLRSFPTEKQSLASVKKLRETIWPIYSPNDDIELYRKKIEQIIFSEFEMIPDIKRSISLSDFSLPIFRVRPLQSFIDINRFCEHSYPPIKFASLNRCNYNGKPVFYCSNNPLTALLEVVRNTQFKGIKFCISKWNTHNLNENIVFQTFLHSKMNTNNNFSSIPENEISELDKNFENKLTDDQKKGLSVYLKFLHSTFLDSDNYEVTAFFANRAMNAPHEYATDILLYPSNQTNRKGVNLAISPNFVDNRMFIERFYIVELNNIKPSKDQLNITLTKFGEVKNSKVYWRYLDENDADYRSFFLKDFEGALTNDFGWNFNVAISDDLQR
ncbi:hypothetical protein AAU57_09650 [Nonlabens sp. YIK11]|uniref:RES domain-containing protein n=1 Tax=Nonlabens sp. YIK11 TaxID=1453349 RepID=UPI0006DC22BA|nr:RES domain-containing protein [Nonlabens sp. YIK11]KQC33549.1 hypothetical protein AAU57_09650 [Nonlabens sp. YIK11]